MEFTFKLSFELLDNGVDIDALIENFGAAGYTDSLVGVGQAGRVTLEFTREDQDELAAKASAIAAVKNAIPTANLAEIVDNVCN